MSDAKITIPLDLPDVNVLEVKITKNGLRISVESTLKGTTCRQCGRAIEKLHEYGTWIEVRHLPILEQAVVIRYGPKRYRCPYCEGRPTTTQVLSWHVPPSPFTRVYEDYLLKALIHSTVQDVSQKEGVGYDAVLGVLQRRVANRVDWSALTHLGVVGIDEIALKKGQRDFVVLVSARAADGHITLLGVLPDRQKGTVQAFLESIPDRLKATIHSVCVDMYESYLQAVQAALPNAQIVVDRFHVVKQYTELVDKVRRQGMARLKKTLPKAEYQTLKGSHLVFRKHRADLTAEDRGLLERLFAHIPKLRVVYGFREQLFSIFEKATSLKQAADDFRTWIFLVKEQAIEPLLPFVDTLNRYWTFILNFFNRRLNSGFVEGLNHKVRVLLWRSFGLFNLDRLFQRLWLDIEGSRAFGYTH